MPTARTSCGSSSRRAGGYVKIQLRSSGRSLDADHCASPVTLNPGSTYADGACQLWRLVPAGGGWYRVQLKANGQVLDAAFCSMPIGLNPGSTSAGGACQLWKPMPEPVIQPDSPVQNPGAPSSP